MLFTGQHVLTAISDREKHGSARSMTVLAVNTLYRGRPLPGALPRSPRIGCPGGRLSCGGRNCAVASARLLTHLSQLLERTGGEVRLR